MLLREGIDNKIERHDRAAINVLNNCLNTRLNRVIRTENYREMLPNSDNDTRENYYIMDG